MDCVLVETKSQQFVHVEMIRVEVISQEAVVDFIHSLQQNHKINISVGLIVMDWAGEPRNKYL